jgi:hypothetical protein
MVGYGREVETALLGADRIAHKIQRPMLLAHQFVSEFEHRLFLWRLRRIGALVRSFP